MSQNTLSFNILRIIIRTVMAVTASMLLTTSPAPVMAQSIVVNDLEYSVSPYFPGECSVRILPLWESTDSGFLLPVPRVIEGNIQVQREVKIAGGKYKVTEVQWGGFEDHSFGSVSLPVSLQEIAHLAFHNTRGSYHLPGSIDIIGQYAFAGCSGKMTLEEGIRIIDDNAFGGFEPEIKWSGTKALVLPSTIERVGRTIIGTDLGGKSDALFSELQCLALTPPEVEEGPDGEADLCAYSNSYSRIVLYVPDRSVTAYKSAPGWKKFATILPLSRSGMDITTVTEEITIRGEEGAIIIECDDSSQIPVKIYTPDGRQVYFGYSRRIPLSPGLYLVRASSTSAKVRL